MVVVTFLDQCRGYNDSMELNKILKEVNFVITGAACILKFNSLSDSSVTVAKN